MNRKANGGNGAIKGTHDIDKTTTADDGDGFDRREAARLLAQAKPDAKRQFNLSPPWITAFAGAVILVGYAALWLSTRGQHPYSGPSHAIIYGVIPAAGPLIIVGPTVLGIAASKADWPQFGAALTVVTTGVVALFVGPSAAWLAAGIGLSLAVAGYAAATGKRLGHS